RIDQHPRAGLGVAPAGRTDDDVEVLRARAVPGRLGTGGVEVYRATVAVTHVRTLVGTRGSGVERLAGAAITVAPAPPVSRVTRRRSSQCSCDGTPITCLPPLCRSAVVTTNHARRRPSWRQ